MSQQVPNARQLRHWEGLLLLYHVDRGGAGDQEELDVPPALADSDHDSDTDSDSDKENEDSDDEWGPGDNANAGVQRGPAVHVRDGEGEDVAGGGAVPDQQVASPQQAAPVLLGGDAVGGNGAHNQPANNLQPPPHPPHHQLDRDPHTPLLGGVEREDLGPWLNPVVPGPIPWSYSS